MSTANFLIVQQPISKVINHPVLKCSNSYKIYMFENSFSRFEGKAEAWVFILNMLDLSDFQNIPKLIPKYFKCKNNY